MHARLKTGINSRVQRRPSSIVIAIYERPLPRAAIQQDIQQGLTSMQDRPVERRSTTLTVNITDTGPVRQQRARDFLVSADGGVHQGRQPVTVSLVAVDLVLHQDAHDSVMALLRRNVQRAQPAIAFLRGGTGRVQSVGCMGPEPFALGRDGEMPFGGIVASLGNAAESVFPVLEAGGRGLQGTAVTRVEILRADVVHFHEAITVQEQPVAAFQIQAIKDPGRVDIRAR